MKNYLIGDYNNTYNYTKLMAKSGAEDFSPLIITCAITGGVHGKEANPNLPETIDEQVQQAYDAYNAGATMVHIHRRDPRDTAITTKDAELYLEVNARIREKCPGMIINNTAMGGRFYFFGIDKEPGDLSLASIPACPEVASIDLFTSYVKRTFPARVGVPFPRESYSRERIYMLNKEDCIEAIRFCEKYGVKPEYECNGIDSLQIYNSMLRSFEPADQPHWFQLMLNGIGTFPTPETIIQFARHLPPNALLSVIAIGACQFPMAAAAIVLGHHIRVGMEDNVYYRKGELATGNGQLVERAARLATEIGRPIATPEQAREMMGLGAPRQYKYPTK